MRRFDAGVWPMTNNSTPPAAPPKPDVQSPMIRRVLIVEDEEVARRQLQTILKADPDLHLQVDVVPDGAQALEALEAVDYSIAITDLRMPKLDGMRLLKTVQERRLPVTVIVATGEGSVDEAVQAMRM